MRPPHPTRRTELTRRGNYQKYLSGNPLQRLLIWYFHRWVNRLLETTTATTILDVGCGEGFTIERLSRSANDRLIRGVDNDLHALLRARETNPRVVFYMGDVECLPFASDAFDVVLCLEVLEHLRDPLTALQELGRVTSKHCLISVPNEPFFMAANLLRGKNVRAWGNDPEHVRNWTATQFLRLVRRHFRVETVVYPFPWVMALCTKPPVKSGERRFAQR